MYYEVIYEDGSHSVASYENDEEALSAVQEHHDRAKDGGAAQEGSSRPAARVAKVFAYDEHPGTYVGKIDKKALKGDSAEALLSEMREMESPVVSSGPHESNYKAEGRELDWEG